jgi:hypothetical protein
MGHFKKKGGRSPKYHPFYPKILNSSSIKSKSFTLEITGDDNLRNILIFALEYLRVVP